MVSRGALIVLEGCDKAGKSTHSRLLTEALRSKGNNNVRLMNFPDRSTTIGKMLDQYLKQDLELKDEAVHLLFSANRWELVPEIEATLAKGTSVIIDRYSYSGIAFTAAKGLDLDWCRAPEIGLPKPDTVLFLNLGQNEASKRDDYGQERYEKVEFQEKVKEIYFQLKDDTYWRLVDTNRPIEVVHKECYDIVLETINRKDLKPIQKLNWNKS